MGVQDAGQVVYSWVVQDLNDIKSNFSSPLPSLLRILRYFQMNEVCVCVRRYKSPENKADQDMHSAQAHD